MRTEYWSWDLKGSVTLNVGLHGWEDNIKMDFQQLRCDSTSGIYVCRDKIQKHNPVNTGGKSYIHQLSHKHFVDKISTMLGTEQYSLFPSI